MTIEVPPGCELGHTWRVKGKGNPGAPPGDLTVKIAGYSENEGNWRIVGKDVHQKVRVTLYQSYVREVITVKSPWGRIFHFCHELGDPRPTKIKGQGVKVGRVRGDLIVEWELVYPPRGSLELASLLRYLHSL